MRPALKAALAATMVAALAAPGAGAKPVAKAAAKPAATPNWTETYAATPEGGFRRGNPSAAVKLIEYGSLTCSHCRDFHGAAMRPLVDKYVANGRLSYEYRSFVLNGPDYAAALVARCSGNPRTFFSALDSFYPDQSQWLQPFSQVSDDESRRIDALPEDKRVAAIAVAGKLDVYAAKLGMSRARFDACLADKVQGDKLLEIRKTAVETYKVTGTPGFLINGIYQDKVFDWAALEPKLRAAMTR